MGTLMTVGSPLSFNAKRGKMGGGGSVHGTVWEPTLSV